ncbi:non-homologous end-joining DNA ligase [Alicyclobacillus dauci]|uniref:Non-homologous end-joining DNA ligase n=1 Tax=Alicyclobacillus dauci TaxID=1475485 RepID=A0ABY6YYI6_9BACL|nr:non-homologous end-joining DNA ligase [Alicyclobacillus dauci]WAH35144.1 non-homologous end-joining DNA ligase [Alicyclobacillus dauci]
MALQAITLQAEHPVKLTHPDKLLFDEPPTTKLEYAHYLIKVAPNMIKHLRDRRITLVRCPEGVMGERFYQRHILPGGPEWLQSVVGEEEKEEIVIPDIATLLYYANLGAIEFHATISHLGSQSSRTLSFDLDPSTSDFEPVREVALHLRDVLSGLGLNSIVKTSGASGLQVFVPLSEEVPFTETKLLVTFIAKYMEQSWPKLVTTARLVRERGSKVYVDAPQHGKTKTLIAHYSVRATPQATVSTPLFWHELENGAKPTDFTIRNVPDRLLKIGDLFASTEPSSARPVVKLLQEKQ